MAVDLDAIFAQTRALFTSIPMDNPLLVPYDDVQARAPYGRPLLLPDDVIPTLSLVTLAKHPNGPRLWTGSHQEGVADVYVTNQAGGGGATGNYSALWQNTDPRAFEGGNFNYTPSPFPSFIYGWKVRVIAFGAPPGGHNDVSWLLQVTDALNHNQFTLDGGFLQVASGGGSFVNTDDYAEVMLPTPMNLAETLPTGVAWTTFSLFATSSNVGMTWTLFAGS